MIRFDVQTWGALSETWVDAPPIVAGTLFEAYRRALAKWGDVRVRYPGNAQWFSWWEV